MYDHRNRDKRLMNKYHGPPLGLVQGCADEDCTQCCGVMGARMATPASTRGRSTPARSRSSFPEPPATQTDISQLLRIFEDSDDGHRPHGAAVESDGGFDGGHGDYGGDGDGLDLSWNNMDDIEEDEAADEKSSKAGEARHRVQKGKGKKRARDSDDTEDEIQERRGFEDDRHEKRTSQSDKGNAHKKSRRRSGDKERQQHEGRSAAPRPGRRQAASGQKLSVSDSSDERGAGILASPATPARCAAGGEKASGAARGGNRAGKGKAGAGANRRQTHTASERKGRQAPSENSDSSAEEEIHSPAPNQAAQRRVLVTYGKSSSARTTKHSSKATVLSAGGDEMPRQGPAKEKGKGKGQSRSLSLPPVKSNAKGPRGFLTCSVDSCPARCTNRRALQMHMLAVHSDIQAAVDTNVAAPNANASAMFPCPFQLCPRTYTHRRTLLEHLKAVHSGGVSGSVERDSHFFATLREGYGISCVCF